MPRAETGHAGLHEVDGGLEAIDRIVLAAAALDTGDRLEYLRQLTVTDPRVLDGAWARLEAARGLPTSFLSLPVSELMDAITLARASASPGAPPMAAAQRYELGERLGRGGMATVQSAFDHLLQRQVALKLLHSGSDRDGVDRERFLAEARAQARVRHEHVLEIYDTGEMEIWGESRPFLAMRPVDGGTLTDLVAEASMEECVRLAWQAAEGLHAAHREGLVHRDVKPSNLLLESDAEGRLQVRVSDFGIALDAGTMDGKLAGTPAYMAPELLDDPERLDRRVDVYGLGVCLYELLSGRRPFEGDSVVEILRQVRIAHPPSLAQVAPTVPKELVAIIERCMARDPEGRYSSARELSQDLRRFLDGEPVQAMTSTAIYRLSKVLVRHRRLASISALAALLLLLVSMLAGLAGIRARIANARAESRQYQAEELITFMLGDLRQRLDAVGRLDILDAVGVAAMEYFAVVPEDELSTAELARRSQALYQVGEVRLSRGQLSQAYEPLRQSLELARALSERSPGDPERLFGLGQSEFWVGYSAWKAHRLGLARRHFETYLDISRRLVELDPSRLDFRLELGYAYSNLGSLAEEEGKLGEASACYRRMMEVAEALVAEKPGDLDYRFELASVSNQLGQVANKRGHLDRSLDYFQRDLEIRRDLLERDPSNVRHREFLATSHDYLAEAHRLLGASELEGEHLGRAEMLLRRLVEHDPGNADWRFKLGLLLRKMARWHLENGQSDRAARALHELESLLAHPIVGESGEIDMWHRWLLAVAERTKAQFSKASGRPREALETLASALEQLSSLEEDFPSSEVRFTTMGALYDAYHLADRLGQETAAEDFLRQLGARLEGADEVDLRPRIVESRVLFLAASGRTADALEWLRRLQATGHRARSFRKQLEEVGLGGPLASQEGALS